MLPSINVQREDANKSSQYSAYSSNSVNSEPSVRQYKSVYKDIFVWYLVSIFRFEKLSVSERQYVLTETSPEFTKMLIELLNKNKGCKGDEILTVIPSTVYILAEPREELKVKKII